MSNTKIVMGQAANTLVTPLDVEDVFSTYLYEGNEASSRSISNGINLSDEGGLVWFKARASSISVDGNELVDTERGVQEILRTDTTGGNSYDADHLTAFNTDGFTISDDSGCNQNSTDYVSWTFRKAPKFFDAVKISITRDGSNNLTSNNSNATVINNVVYVNHNLDSVPGLWIQKCMSATGNWFVRSTSFLGFLKLNSNTAKAGSITHTATSTQAMLDDYGTGSFAVGTHEYIIYLFAAGGDGEFGPSGDQDIIKCGVFTPNTSGEVTVDLGFEPQFLIYKNIESVDPWIIFDTMRGWGSSVQDWQMLAADSSAAEEGLSSLQLTSTGFTTGGTGSLTNKDYIYIAIRRGTKVPESGTEVFAVSDRKNEIPSFPSGFPVDFLIGPRTINGADNNEVKTRLISGGYLRTNTTGAENSSDQSANFAHNDGFFNFAGANANQYSWMWKRAPGFFDVVAYGGTGNTTQTKNHNLGVVPEMIWAKRRSGIGQWGVYHKDIGFLNTLVLNDTSALQSASAYWKATPTETEFYVGPGLGASGEDYIAYLFASLDGISKVGSYTGNGSSQNIDCGFSSGARFVLIKRTDNSGSWWVFDTERGIVSGNDAALALDSTSAEISVDWIDPYSAGFKVATSFSEINASGGSYIFYAVA